MFLTEIAMLQHRVEVAPGVVPDAIRHTALALNAGIAEALERAADRVEGTPTGAPPDLRAPLAALEAAVRVQLGSIKRVVRRSGQGRSVRLTVRMSRWRQRLHAVVRPL